MLDIDVNKNVYLSFLIYDKKIYKFNWSFLCWFNNVWIRLWNVPLLYCYSQVVVKFYLTWAANKVAMEVILFKHYVQWVNWSLELRVRIICYLKMYMITSYQCLELTLTLTLILILILTLAPNPYLNSNPNSNLDLNAPQISTLVLAIVMYNKISRKLWEGNFNYHGKQLQNLSILKG